MKSKHNQPGQKELNREKILLALLPFWTPQIPPMGISCLKSHLERQGIDNVKTVDANVEPPLRQAYDRYFQTLHGFIPGDKRGNFSSIGNDVWQNHMMAHLNYTDEQAYHSLVKLLVGRVFYHEPDDSQVHRLNKVVADMYLEIEKFFLELLERERPTVLGLTVFIGTLPASLYAFQLAKQKYPRIKTVIGGGVFYDQLRPGTVNFDRFCEKTRDYIDKIIVGEGEILFHKLLKGELPASQRVFTQQDLGGQVLDISAGVQLPDLSDFKLNYYPGIGAYATRSCPYRCNFCSGPTQWGKYRKKSPKQVVEEFTLMYQKYNYQLFIMSDLLMNPIIEELSEELLKSHLSFYFDSPLRVSKEVGKIENTMKWRRAGYYRVEMGCESGSQRILESMNKRITVEETKAAVTALAQAGIKTTTYWVIGYPGETEADFQATLDLVEELKDDIYEAMNNAFFYYQAGQVKSGKWKEKLLPLYPPETVDMLMLQQWILDCEPTREERYRRVNRFVKHCVKLGIPDIFTMQELYNADERWKRLHKNAVPGLMEFKTDGKTIDENKKVKNIDTVAYTMTHDDNWGF